MIVFFRSSNWSCVDFIGLSFGFSVNIYYLYYIDRFFFFCFFYIVVSSSSSSFYIFNQIDLRNEHSIYRYRAHSRKNKYEIVLVREIILMNFLSLFWLCSIHRSKALCEWEKRKKKSMGWKLILVARNVRDISNMKIPLHYSNNISIIFIVSFVLIVENHFHMNPSISMKNFNSMWVYYFLKNTPLIDHSMQISNPQVYCEMCYLQRCSPCVECHGIFTPTSVVVEFQGREYHQEW